MIDKARLTAFAVVAALSLGTGWQLHAWKVAYDLERDRIAQEAADALVREISGKTLEQIAGIRIENKTIYQQGRTEVLRETIYRDCVLPDSGRRLLESAREN
ncbi:MAG TPA: hypothetical protein DEP32_14425 [Pseudomonas sp.]|nr:hypothetical protein [Pseudomonas sp.]MBB50155.1 hypothetical protein [Pseudomonadales bacterium]MBB50597.1 hypothetical protein [Pseudomonadales bacterium]MBO08900.1 hypothetical protein [Acidobacteriota bacterium]HCA25356.1 hypothetical protein [Pseudomonas sp.]|tara:strand:- start:4389 stop:4694 length:306 start_codon:yes stop_codon:yes gene_type:complete